MSRVVILFLMVFSPGSTILMAQSYSAMSYNVRYDNPNDGDDNWHKRKEYLVSQVQFYEPDILGVQEALHHMVTYLDEELADYSYVGVGREDGQTKGEYSAIFYKHSRFDVRTKGTFWLSETPGKPSKGWDANLERICSYVELEERETRRTIWAFNAHFDHRGQEARAESGKLIVEKIKELAGLTDPVVLTGDFNAVPDSEPIQPLAAFLEDARYCKACVVFGQEGTWNGFDALQTESRRIDYAFTRNVTVEKYAVFSELITGRFISDHHPVYIQFSVD